MQAAQGLGLAEQSGEVLDRWRDKASPLQIEVNQVQVILDEVLEAVHNLLVKRDQLYLSLAFDYLLNCQLRLLILQEDVISEGEVFQVTVILDNLEQFEHHNGSDT